MVACSFTTKIAIIMKTITNATAIVTESAITVIKQTTR